MQSRAPEYSGSSELPPPSNPPTPTATAGEAATSATPSAASAPAAPPVVAVPRLPGTPELSKDGLYVFSGGGIELAVEPRRDGTIARLSLDGKNVLIRADWEPSGFRNTSHENPIGRAAPPPDPPDNYRAEVEGSTLVLRANANFVKRYRLDTARRSVEISYTFVDHGPPYGMYEFHRVPSAGGLTFFPSASKLLPGSTLKLNVWQPLVWLVHDQVQDPKTVEASVDSTEGWLATITDGLLLVKTFGAEAKTSIVVKSAAYDPSTKQRPWVELGEAREGFQLQQGSSATWNVRYFLRKLPPNIAPKSGNQELVGFVRGVIQ